MVDLEQKLHQYEYGALESSDCCENGDENGGGTSIRNAKEQFTVTYPPPPEGTTTFGAVAWYASGPQGEVHSREIMLGL